MFELTSNCNLYCRFFVIANSIAALYSLLALLASSAGLVSRWVIMFDMVTINISLLDHIRLDNRLIMCLLSTIF